ncbi:titin-like [Dermacentor silvarum]|uniref:titin-like n=1 Tax=Dermacentor silvarum TaxID=543639 RepID=UPI002100A7E8|nr:titin-like [Dermacentor silvarum]
MLVTILLVTTTTLASSIEAGAEPPRLHPFAFPKDHPLGQAIAVTCIASQGVQPLHFEWLKDGRPLPIQGHKANSKMVTASVSLLTVIDVGAEDVGNYTCTATNAAGSDGFTAELAVAEAPKLQPVYIAKDHPLLETLVVSCIAIRGSQPLKFAWFKDGHPLNEGTRAMPRSLTDTLSTLTIPKVTAEDVGNYTCRVSNAVGSDSYSAELLVTDQPRMQPFAFPPNVNAGEEVSVTCVAALGRKPFRFDWEHDGRVLANGARKHSRVVVDNIVTMTIERVTAEDVGNYTCTVTNEFGSDSAIYGCVDSGRVANFRVDIVGDGLATTGPNAVLGQKATVTCVVSRGAGPFRFAWTHDSNRIDNSPRRHVKVLTENVAALTVEAATAEDVGNYTCTVSNAAGSASYTAALRVEAPPMIMPISLANNIALGEKILLTCAVTRGTAPFEIRWTHEGRPVTNTKNKYAAPLTGSIATLTIEKVTAEDVGNYTCSASNDVGRDTVTATLMVEEAPQIQPFSFPKDPRANSKMVISCNAHVGTEPITFVWLKDGHELSSGTKVKQKTVTETVSMLIIPEVSSEDIGNYTCEATNRFGRDTFTAALLLTESPKIQPFFFPKNHPVGKDVTVTCFATEGALPLTFQWLKDGEILAGGSKFAVKNPLEKMSTLIIHQVSGADIGNYTCRVSNEAGNDVFTASLVVTVEAPKVQPFSFPSTKAMPKKVIVHCAVLEGTEPLKFVWTKDGVPVENGHRLHVKQHSETLSSLTITDVGAEDIGNYTCTVSNVAGSDSATSKLLVKAPADAPSVHPFAFPKDHQRGRTVAVTCIVNQGTPPFSFAWSKDGRPLQAGREKPVSKMITESVSVLTVPNVGAEDVGNYTCSASNAAGSASFTAELLVVVLTEAPRLQPFYFPKDHPLLETLVVSCIAIRGTQPVQFAWSKDGLPVVAGGRAVTQQLSATLSTLTIPTVAAQDVGNYTCRASNAVGSDSYSAELLVTENVHSTANGKVLVGHCKVQGSTAPRRHLALRHVQWSTEVQGASLYLGELKVEPPGMRALDLERPLD